MPDLTVPHIVIRGHTNGCPMGLQRRIKPAFKKLIENRGFSHVNAITFILLADPDTIHDNQKQGAWSSMKIFQFF
jgi:hypothetical protein